MNEKTIDKIGDEIADAFIALSIMNEKDLIKVAKKVKPYVDKYKQELDEMPLDELSEVEEATFDRVVSPLCNMIKRYSRCMDTLNRSKFFIDLIDVLNKYTGILNK